jgi:hypothetical protein
VFCVPAAGRPFPKPPDRWRGGSALAVGRRLGRARRRLKNATRQRRRGTIGGSGAEQGHRSCLEESLALARPEATAHAPLTPGPARRARRSVKGAAAGAKLAATSQALRRRAGLVCFSYRRTATRDPMCSGISARKWRMRPIRLKTNDAILKLSPPGRTQGPRASRGRRSKPPL